MRDQAQKPSEIQLIKSEKRPAKLTGTTAKILTGCGAMYVTVNKNNNGNIFEVLTDIGKAGGCAASQTSVISELISFILQCRANPDAIIRRLKGVSCWQSNNDDIHSCANAIGIVLERVIKEEQLRQEIYSVAIPEKWIIEGVAPPTIKCKKLAESLVLKLYKDFSLYPLHISATIEEGVFLKYVNDINKHELSIEIYNDLDIAAMITKDDKIIYTIDILGIDGKDLNKLAGLFKNN